MPLKEEDQLFTQQEDVIIFKKVKAVMGRKSNTVHLLVLLQISLLKMLKVKSMQLIHIENHLLQK